MATREKMISVTAKMNVKQGSELEFERSMLDLVSKVNDNEPGVIFYRLCQDSDGNYVVIELYEDELAVKDHVDSDHLKAARTSFKGIMAGPPEIQRYDVLGPARPTKTE
jgi:quinol monooxygenase YgiN